MSSQVISNKELRNRGIILHSIFFDWDENKNRANIQKHGVSFVEAMTVFDDDDAMYKPDAEHSQDEDRFVILGLSKNTRLLVVCHCYRESETIVRIISARKAAKSESEQYGGRS